MRRFMKLFRRAPDYIIGGREDPYMYRWYVIPRNRWFNIYLHEFLRDDDDRALHDHPWWSFSVALKGRYIEHTRSWVRRRRAGSLVVRSAKHAHRVELLRDGEGKPIPAWTLFMTGPRVREWGFHCPNGWRHWKKFVSERDTGNVGRGCD